MIKSIVISEEKLDIFNEKVEEILNKKDVIYIDYCAVSSDDNTLGITQNTITYTAMIVYEEN